MLAIFKREVKAYFNSPIAYVLIGLFILLSSIVFWLNNLESQSVDFNSNLSFMGGFLLLFFVPILTMRILAEDRKNGTEVLLVTSPLSLTSMIVGKFLASLFVFVVITIITFIYPIVLFIFGKPAMSLLLVGYLGFMLLAASCIAIGIFASSLTENQIISVFSSFVMLLIAMIIKPIGNALGGKASEVSNWFSLFSRFDDSFTRGILDLSSVVYYLTFIAVFLFLTIRVIDKRRWSKG